MHERITRQFAKPSALILMLCLGGVAPVNAQSDFSFEFALPDPSGSSIVCESVGGGFRQCRADTRDGVYLLEQLSKSPCIRGHSWDYTRRGIWVDQGCRGEFALGYRDDRLGRWSDDDRYGAPLPTRRQTLYCGSDDNRTRRCNVTVRRDVRVLHQASKAPCLEGSSWGWDRDGIWVSRGCRADFGVD
jgi:hypothetical protein